MNWIPIVNNMHRNGHKILVNCESHLTKILSPIIFISIKSAKIQCLDSEFPLSVIQILP
jgi:hypothetical protein